jgi:hypothetical protein
MTDRTNTLAALKKELEFLESGGYRDPDRWSQSLVFEDSHTCTNPHHPQGGKCGRECPFLTFVPVGRRDTPIPCRYIPLNEGGYTLDSMYRLNSSEEIEAVLRQWLKKEIAQFESADRTNSARMPTGE